MLAVGEIRTGLLQNSAAVPAALAAQTLELQPGERVRSSERPIAHAVSPDRLAGLDCRLPTRSGARVRGIGTAITRASITGGRVLQASSHTVLVGSDADRRLPWAHYLARPGVVEIGRRAARDGWADLADGFLDRAQPDTLDLGALTERMLADIVVRPQLDRRAPFRVQRTVLRWAATTADATSTDTTDTDTDTDATDTGRAAAGADPGAGPAAGRAGAQPPSAQFSLVTATLRTARLTLPAAALPAVLDFCEDLALHDWLLSTVIGVIERSRPDAARGLAALHRIRPAVDHLLHLWMPAARVDRQLLPLWESLERRPGFTRQWEVSVNRIRDQIAMTTVGLLGIVAEGVAQA